MHSDLGQSLLFLAKATLRRVMVRLSRLGYRPERRYMRDDMLAAQAPAVHEALTRRG